MLDPIKFCSAMTRYIYIYIYIEEIMKIKVKDTMIKSLVTH